MTTSTLTLIGDIRQARQNDKTRVLHPFSVVRKTDELSQSTFNLESLRNDDTLTEVSFGNIEKARLIIIFSDQWITASVDNGTNRMSFEEVFVLGGGKGSDESMTQLGLNNQSGSTASVTIFIVGSAPE